MASVKFAIANIVIEVQTICLQNFDFLRDFISTGDPDFKVVITLNDIEQVRIDVEQAYGHFTDWNGYFEVFAILKKVTEALIEYNIILMHGAVVAVDDAAYLFTAPSGVGKTTHIMKWIENIPGSFVINGDKPFIKINDDGTALACGSPWAGKENIYRNKMVPLKAITILERSTDNLIHRISFSEAFPDVFKQVQNTKELWKTIHLLQRMSSSVDFYKFSINNFKADCFQTAYEAIVGTIR